MNKKVFQLLVDNTSGVLSRISGLFSRRGYNIESITAGVTADPKYSRVTIVSSGDQNTLEQIEKQLAKLEQLGFGSCPVCIAKTQYSFSDDPSKLGAPENFTVTVKNVKISAGAGFVVVLTGDILTMPGLPKVPAAEKIDVDDNGRIVGLF